MAKIVGIGIAALDIINITDGYPAEDSEVRALDQRVVRGGNVTNMLVVLSQLGHECHWGGTLGNDAGSQIIIEDLLTFSVNTQAVKTIAGKHTPTSYITLNQHNGSRTIVHYRDLPEYTVEDFSLIDLHSVDWLHFEGRNVDQVLKMIKCAKARHPYLTISVEIEKFRPDIELLFDCPDILFFSRHYAHQNGFSRAEQLLTSMQSRIRTDAQIPLLICTWGEQGAYALHNGNIIHASAPSLDTIIDTIGAGDTFNAGFIHSYNQHKDIDSALKQACALASKKCSQWGFSGLTAL